MRRGKGIKSVSRSVSYAIHGYILPTMLAGDRSRTTSNARGSVHACGMQFWFNETCHYLSLLFLESDSLRFVVNFASDNPHWIFLSHFLFDYHIYLQSPTATFAETLSYMSISTGTKTKIKKKELYKSHMYKYDHYIIMYFYYIIIYFFFINNLKEYLNFDRKLKFRFNFDWKIHGENFVLKFTPKIW